MINLKEFPIAFKQDLILTFSNVRKEVKSNEKIIKISKDSEFQIYMDDIDVNSTFYFNIEQVVWKDGRAVYTYEFAPANSSTNNQIKITNKKDPLLQHLKTWIDRIKVHNSTTDIHPANKVFTHNLDEFFTKFKLLEEDADDAPYSTDKQILISGFLGYSVQQLEDHDQKKFSDLINEGNELQDNLGSLTKNEVVFRLAQFYVKLKMGSFKVYEIILKKGVNWGYNKIFDNLLELAG